MLSPDRLYVHETIGLGTVYRAMNNLPRGTMLTGHNVAAHLDTMYGAQFLGGHIPPPLLRAIETVVNQERAAMMQQTEMVI